MQGCGVVHMYQSIFEVFMDNVKLEECGQMTLHCFNVNKAMHNYVRCPPEFLEAYFDEIP